MRKLLPVMFCVLFFGGLLLAGSEGPYFPIVNVCGAAAALLAAGFVPALNRMEQEAGRNE